jgi:hypothetical protein
MFDSLDPTDARQLLRRCRPASPGTVLPAGAGWGARLLPPALATVRGGFTVSGLQGFGDDDSPEALVRSGPGGGGLQGC